ncbi:hypothetical protein ACFP1Z_19025 [Streptomyces gamaensis]|uniref:ESX-1 secretion-associated protein n=1 Tax=Streptomyces gamaensis TaxID=1763542 RepID=A0ABW0Z0M3_9ACTN
MTDPIDTYEVVPADGPDRLVPLDIATIKATIAEATALTYPASLASTALTLYGHLGVLLAAAAEQHPDLIASVGRRLTHGIPDATKHPERTRQWVEESARTAAQLLALVTADEATELRHAAARQ